MWCKIYIQRTKICSRKERVALSFFSKTAYRTSSPSYFPLSSPFPHRFFSSLLSLTPTPSLSCARSNSLIPPFIPSLLLNSTPSLRRIRPIRRNRAPGITLAQHRRRRRGRTSAFHHECRICDEGFAVECRVASDIRTGAYCFCDCFRHGGAAG